LFEQAGVYDSQFSLADAESALLDIADYVYAHTSLKPISKTLFLLSRCLCVAKLRGAVTSAKDLTKKYNDIRTSLDGSLLPTTSSSAASWQSANSTSRMS
jgi:hypothetical protein